MACPLAPQQVREASLSCLFSAAAAVPRAPRARPLPWRRAPDAAEASRGRAERSESRADVSSNWHTNANRAGYLNVERRRREY